MPKTAASRAAARLRHPSRHPIMPPADAELFSTNELAGYLRCGVDKAYYLIRDGEIPSFKLGKKRLVKRTEAEKYVDRLARAARRSA
jgi:excisionase family DNA binding protein